MAAYDQLLARHLPDGLLLDQALEIVHYFGQPGRYLRPLAGRARAGILSRVEGDLKLALSVQLPRAMKTGSPSTSRGVRVTCIDGSQELIDLVADPLCESSEPTIHVSFLHPRPAPQATQGAGGDLAPGDAAQSRLACPRPSSCSSYRPAPPHRPRPTLPRSTRPS